MGLLFMLASAAGAGILFTLLVWIDSHTWIYIRKRFDSPALTPPSGWYLTRPGFVAGLTTCKWMSRTRSWLVARSTSHSTRPPCLRLGAAVKGRIAALATSDLATPARTLPHPRRLTLERCTL